MKKLLLLLLLVFGFQGYSKAIPKPSVLFSISDIILTQAQEFIFPSTDKVVVKPAKTKTTAKPKIKAVKVLDITEEKPAPKIVTKIYRDGMWIIAE